MANFSIKAKAEQLGLDFAKLTDDLARDMVATVHQLAASTYNKAVELASQRLHGTRQDYINALQLSQEGDGIWVVSLDPEANDLEDGYDSFQMLPKLAMGPKSKPLKDGSGRYVVIPMRQRMSPLNPSNPKQADLASRLKELSKIRKWEKVREGVSGATGKYTTIERMKAAKDDHPHLKGLTRIREYKQKGDKAPSSSAYFTFRTASTKMDPSKHFVHPGFRGAKIWPDLEQYAEEQLEQILVEFLM